MSFWAAMVLISLIAMIGGVISSKHRAQAGIGQDAGGNQFRLHDPQNDALRKEVEELRDRVKVLERIVTDGRDSRSLSEQIESLRDR